jgi:hypothetical protein
MELCPYSLEFQSCTTIKSQAPVNIIAKWTDLSTSPNQGLVEYWKMYFDGSLNIDGVGAGVLFISPTKEQLCYSSGSISLHLTMLQNTRPASMACELQSNSV